MMNKDTVELHFPTDPEHYIALYNVSNEYEVVKHKNKWERDLTYNSYRKYVTVKLYPFLFSKLCLPFMSYDFVHITLFYDFGDQTLCVSVKNGLTLFNWFDTSNHTSQTKHNFGISCLQFSTQNAGEPHPSDLAINVITYCFYFQINLRRIFIFGI